MLLPVGACDDGAHSQNEKINMTNYIQGVSDLTNRVRNRLMSVHKVRVSGCLWAV